MPHYPSNCGNPVEYNRVAALVAASVYAENFKPTEFNQETKSLVSRLRTILSLQQLNTNEVDIAVLLDLSVRYLANLKQNTNLLSLTGRVRVLSYHDSVSISFDQCISTEQSHGRASISASYGTNYAQV